MILSHPHFLFHALSIQIIILGVINPCLGATFNAKTQFSWVDSSCDSVIDQVNNAGDDYNALVTAAIANLEGGSPSTELGKGTLVAYFGTPVGQLINLKYGRLQAAFAAQPIALGLYCDGSAFEWVTTYQEGPKKGQDLPNGGQWHAQEGRYNPAEGPLYLDGTKTPQRTSICQTPQGQNAQGVSAIGGKHIILCPDAFAEPVLGAIPTTEQTLGTSLDTLTSTGAVLLHEVTHCVLSTVDTTGGYKVGGVLLTAKISSKAQKNADTWMYYAMASLAAKNAWVIGVAQAIDNFGPKAPKAPPSTGKRDTLPFEPRAVPADDPTNMLALPGSPILKARAQSPETVTVTVTVTQDCPGTGSGGSTSAGSTGAGSTGTGSTGTGSTGAGSTGAGSTGAGSTGTGSTGTGSTGTGFTGTGSTSNSSPGGVSTGSGSTGTGSTVSGSTYAGPTSGGSTGAGSTGKGSTGSGSTGAGSTGSGPAVGTASTNSGSNVQSASSGKIASNTNTASGFTTVKSNPGSSAGSAGSGGYIGPVPISAEPASITAALASQSSVNIIGLTSFTGTTTPIAVEISSSVSSNGHTQKTNGVGPFPIFWSHTCWFCPPGLCFLCGIQLDLPPGIYPPGSIAPPPGWTGPLPTITIGNDGTPSYDEEEPEETNNQPSNSANSQASSAAGPSSATRTSPATITSSSASSASSGSSAVNYVFETPAIYSEVSDTVPFASISAVVASEFAANSINGDLDTPSTSAVASSASTQNSQSVASSASTQNSQPAASSASTQNSQPVVSSASTQNSQPVSTTFSSKQVNTTPTTTAKPSTTSLQTSITTPGTGFSCTSSQANPEVPGYPCLCQGFNYCSSAGGGCGWTTVPAAEDCCLDCM